MSVGDPQINEMASSLDTIFESRQSNFEMKKPDHAPPKVDYTISMEDMPQHSHTMSYATQQTHTIDPNNLYVTDHGGTTSWKTVGEHDRITVGASNPSDVSFKLLDDDGLAIVQAYTSGHVKINQLHKLNEAAQRFWKEVINTAPTTGETVEKLEAKTKEVERLEQRVQELEYLLEYTTNVPANTSLVQEERSEGDELALALTFDNAQRGQF